MMTQLIVVVVPSCLTCSSTPFPSLRPSVTALAQFVLHYAACQTLNSQDDMRLGSDSVQDVGLMLKLSEFVSL